MDLTFSEASRISPTIEDANIMPLIEKDIYVVKGAFAMNKFKTALKEYKIR